MATNLAPLFGTVLQNGVSAQWYKKDADCYAYDTNGNAAYDSGSDIHFQYLSAAGTFLQVGSC